MNDHDVCPACLNPLVAGLRDWHLQCTNCTYEGSSLRVEIDVAGSVEILDEQLREEGLSHLRRSNFQMLIARLPIDDRAGRSRPRKLLDVGCAHGWFLQLAGSEYEVLGIEPDSRSAALAASHGLPVRQGFFPHALESAESFDVIVFNDVIEHIPDIGSALTACIRHLAPGGRVILNAPARTGILYRVSRFLARSGFPASFERMWQKGFPSPHVHYLDEASVRTIAARSGLRLVDSYTLPTLSTHGLYARIRYDRSVSRLKAATITGAMVILAPFLRFLPADIKVWTLKAS
ncbi:class I SAM-dependent methyltransferase [Luteimonas deserti]|uniref:Class I SAM-dependent methyltransferase n=1 Tax=Luteimonas deserti TaxID=2752306 RepID=A0A7Z0QRM7_9GAMM|nr:class I SAM-dependent methyltransferase [Luteimonas deserti]NYZ62268.1 class I SAM-dependent methyltransferase [Luteimonas deserti]